MKDGEMGMINECIDNLEQQIRWIGEIDAHKFAGWKHTVDAMKQAVVLLKAQEPVKPIRMNHNESKWIDHYKCPICDNLLAYYNHYCSDCGRPVKWE